MFLSCILQVAINSQGNWEPIRESPFATQSSVANATHFTFAPVVSTSVKMHWCSEQPAQLYGATLLPAALLWTVSGHGRVPHHQLAGLLGAAGSDLLDTIPHTNPIISTFIPWTPLGLDWGVLLTTHSRGLGDPKKGW